MRRFLTNVKRLFDGGVLNTSAIETALELPATVSWRKVGTLAYDASDVVVPGLPGVNNLLFHQSLAGHGKARKPIDTHLLVFIEKVNMAPGDRVYPLIHELFGPSEQRISPTRKGAWLAYADPTNAGHSVAFTFDHPQKNPEQALFNGCQVLMSLELGTNLSVVGPSAKS
jgi:hypothetical protein